MVSRLRVLLLVLVGVLMPIEYVILFDIGPIPVGPTKLVTALLTVLVLFLWAVGPLRLPRSRKNVWVVLMGLSLAVSTAASLLHGLSAAWILPSLTTNVFVILFYFVMCVAIRDERELDLFLASLVVGGVIISFTAFAGIGYRVHAEEGARLGGLGGNVNELGFNLAIVLPIAFGFMLTSPSRMWRICSVGAIAIALAATANTLSRTTYLVALVMWIYGMIRFSRLDMVRYSILGLLVFAVGINFLPEPVQKRLATMKGDNISRDGSARQRMILNKLAVLAFASNPIIGVGNLRFGTWATERTGAINRGSAVHSAYFKVAAEQGLMGLVPFFAISWFTWTELGRAVGIARKRERAGDRSIRPLRLRALMLQIAFLGVLVGHTAQTSFDYKGTWLMPALATVVTECMRRRVGASVQVPSPSWPASARVT